MGITLTLAVLLALLASPFLIIRINRRLGNAPVSAGPDKVTYPPPPGQEQVPWELLSIVNQLPNSPNGQVSPQMIHTMNRLLDAAELREHGYLPVGANVHQLQIAVALLENHLGLSSTNFPSAPQ